MASLKLSECVCPICLCILVEPVTMPCSHELCMPCFRQNVEQANLTCPMCRLRISNWARKQAGRLVNQARWKSIQEAFPELCRQRIEKGDEEDDVLDLMTQPPPPVIHVAEPGEIGEEYKREAEKVREQYKKELEVAVKQSEEYIRELQKEEVRRIERRQQEQESQEQQDAELARKLAEEGEHAREGVEKPGPSHDEDRDVELARRLAEGGPDSQSSTASSGPGPSQEEQDAQLARRLAQEDSDSVIHRGERVHVMKEQMLKDEELARRLQLSEDQSNSTPLKSPDVVIIHSSGGSSRKNSSSSMKCLSIEKFLSPVASKGRTALKDRPSTSTTRSPTAVEAEAAEVSPVDEAKKGKGKGRGAFSPVVLKAQRIRELDSELRAHSTDSNDSISGEMNHFKPIHVSPRTAHKKLPDGRAESPPIIFTTPRNLQKMDTDVADDQTKDSGSVSSFVQARWKELEAERSTQVNDSSKSTMTGIARHLKKHPSKHHARQGGAGDRKGAVPQERRGESPKEKRGKLPQERRGEPPQKKAKVERCGAGDGSVRGKDPLLDARGIEPIEDVSNNVADQEGREKEPHQGGSGRVETHHKRRQDKCPMNTLLQMRQVVQSDLRPSPPSSCEDGRSGSTDLNHNVNNSKALDSHKKLLSVEDGRDVSRQAGTNCKASSSDDVGGNVGSDEEGETDKDSAEKGTDETDGIAVVPKKRKVYTPIKEYSMREHTKLQTRVTKKSIKDLFNAKKEKSKQKTDPPLPSLFGLEATENQGLCNQEKDSMKKMEVKKSALKQKAYSGIEAAGSSTKKEVSYHDWLSSNGCEQESMQDSTKTTGSSSSLIVSKCTNSVIKESGKLSNGSCHSHGDHGKTNGVGGNVLKNSDEVDSSLSTVPSSQDSDISMASIEGVDGGQQSTERTKTGGAGKAQHGKVKPQKAQASSTKRSPTKSKTTALKSTKKAPHGSSAKKPPRKSEDTILRYMELLNEEQRRLAQEEKDRLLAEQLQKEFDKQSRKERDNVNRAKGSDDAYMLREKERPFYHFVD